MKVASNAEPFVCSARDNLLSFAITRKHDEESHSSFPALLPKRRRSTAGAGT
jgi:hypothetical protein